MHSQDTSPDLKGLALADLQRMLAQTTAAIAERRVEELKVLADGFARKLAANGFSVREGIDALKPGRTRETRRWRASGQVRIAVAGLSMVPGSLAGRSVFITGGAAGIGSALFEQFAGQGCRVALVHRSVAEAKATIERCV